MSRVLVTGAGGFIGRNTLAPLVGAGHEVHAVSSRQLLDGVPSLGGAPDEAFRELAGEVHWHNADLLAAQAPRELLRKIQPDSLLHLAWYTLPGSFWTGLENFEWLASSLRLLRAFGEVQGSRVVIAGSCTEYAWSGDVHCVERLTELRPQTLYGAAKHALHVVAERWAAQTGVELAWGRIFYVYGPDEHPSRLVSAVARALVRGEEAHCTHGRQLRDYIYAPELASAFAALLCSRVTGPVNMASGEPVRLAELVEEIAAAAGRTELVRLDALPQREGEPERITADVRRLHEEVGWRPTIGLREGAVRTVQWWEQSLAIAEMATASA